MTPGRPRRPLAVLALLAALAALAAVGRPDRAAAHPLGNFTTNQYSRIEVAPDGLRLVYVLDLAEIPAFGEIGRVDADGDGELGEAERAAYLAAKLAEIAPGLRLALDGTPLPLQPVARDLTFPEGQAGLKLLRLRAVFAAPLGGAAPVGAGRVTYRNDYGADRLGWREVVVTHAAGVRLEGSDAPTEDLSAELRSYPEDLLSSPPDRTGAAFAFRLDPGAPAAAGFGAAPAGAEAVGPSDTTGGRFAALATGEEELTAAGVGTALLAALVWGAGHALSPGHGKTVVGAYLVGSRGTARHALFLGLTVTATHTAGVVALGLVTLFAARFVVPERLYPWMSLLSGVLVVGMGLAVLRQRLGARPALAHQHHHAHGHVHHAHSHGIGSHRHDPGGHTHAHLPPGADGARVTWRGLLALGVSGGLIPCPSALVVLLGAIALGRVGFGLALVLAFSLGLAAALTGVGLLFLHAGRLLERRVHPAGWGLAVLRYAPVAGAAVLTVVGAAIVARALAEMRLV